MFLKTTGQQVFPLSVNRKTVTVNYFNTVKVENGETHYSPLYNDYEYTLVPLANKDPRLGKTHTIQLISKGKLVDTLHPW
mgnify:CR=1 FL=1